MASPAIIVTVKSCALPNLCLPPHPRSSPQPFQGTIKPRLRWTSPISTLPSTRCPPPRLLFFSPYPLCLSFLPPPIYACPATPLSISPFIPPPCLPPSLSSFYLFYPTSSISRSVLSAPSSPSPLLFSCCSCSAIVCGTGPADRPGQGR